MPRQNEYGKFILSAGEISTYEVCPEAWRLSHVQKVGQNKETPKKSKEGTIHHNQWTEDVEKAVNLERHKIFVFILIGLLVVFYLLRYSI